MRNGSNSKRLRTGRPGGGRSRSAGINRSRNIESNGPAGKVRGNIAQIIDKYQIAARDALSAGDRVVSESCLQYAEHYHRLMTGNTDADPEERHGGGAQAAGSDDATPTPEQGEAGRGEAAQGEGRRRGVRRGPRQARDTRAEVQPEAVAEACDADAGIEPAEVTPIAAGEEQSPVVVAKDDVAADDDATTNEDAAPAPKRTRTRRTSTRTRRVTASAEAEASPEVPSPDAGSVDAGSADDSETVVDEDEGVRRTAQRGRTRTSRTATTRGQRTTPTRSTTRTTRTTRTRRRVTKEAAEGEAATVSDGDDHSADRGDTDEGGSKAAVA